jgi:hypothetical protein
MGGSSSSSARTETINDNLVVNSNTLIKLNDTVNEAISRTVNKQVNNCSGSSQASNVVNLKVGNVKKNLTVDGIDQESNASIDFDCLDASTVSSAIATELLEKTTTALANNSNSVALTKMDTNAESAQKTDGLSIPQIGDSSSTSSNQTTNINKNINIAYTNIQNRLTNRVLNEFTSDKASDCISKAQSTNAVNIQADDVDASVTVKNIKQKAVVDAFIKCQFSTNSTQDIISKTATDLGLKIDNTNISSNKVDIKAASSSKQETTGVTALADSIGKSITAIMDSIGNGFGLGGIAKIFSGGGGISAFFCCCLCCIISLGAAFYIYNNPEIMEQIENSLSG